MAKLTKAEIAKINLTDEQAAGLDAGTHVIDPVFGYTTKYPVRESEEPTTEPLPPVNTSPEVFSA